MVGAARGGELSSATPALQVFPDPTGLLASYSRNGHIDTRNPFFQSLGTNGRSCATCHVASQAMSISPPQVQRRFDATHGADPLFAPVDGANWANVQRSDRAGHSLLLRHGLIRIAITLPPNPQFTLSVVHDPYGCALVTDPGNGTLTVSVYRRPLPATNLSFLSSVMWDGRETPASLSSSDTFAANLQTDLAAQATSAVLGHAQAQVPPSSAQVNAIVAFELSLYSTQVWDQAAGGLFLFGARGGPAALTQQAYYPGINDSLGGDPSGRPFDPSVQGTCTTCHDSPDVGNHSLPLPLDIGVGHPALANFESDPNIAAALAEVDSADLPVFRIDGCADPFHPGTTAPFYTTDPGKALISGQCADLNRMKGPILRALAGRAPYFHNGAAASLRQVVAFYDQRFNMQLSPQQQADLAAFLGSL